MHRYTTVINMPAFLKILAEIKKEMPKIGASNHIYRSLYLEDRVYENAMKKEPKLDQLIRRGWRVTPIFSEIVRDLFQCLYSLRPERSAPEYLTAYAREVSLPLFDSLERSEEFTAAQMKCRGRMLISLYAVLELAEKLLEQLRDIIPRQKGNSKDLAAVLSLLEAMLPKRIRELDRLKEQYENAPSPQLFKKLAKKLLAAQKNADQIRDLRAIIERQRAAARRACSESTRQAARAADERARETSDILAAWSDSPGEENGFLIDSRILEQAQNSDLLTRISHYLGRYRLLLHGRVKNDYTYEYGDAFDVDYGRDIRQASQGELAGLAHPSLLPLLLRKITKGILMQYRVRERVSVGQGDIIICVDESSSTRRDDKDAWGKAVACVLADRARQRGRGCAIIRFSGAGSSQTDLFLPGQYTMNDIMASAGSYFGGGTNYETPLREAVSLMEKGILTKPDIVFITDGACDISDKFSQWLAESMKRFHASITGILLDSGSSFVFSLSKFCKKIYRTSQFEADNIVADLLH